jgi:hypothetical protein
MAVSVSLSKIRLPLAGRLWRLCLLPCLAAAAPAPAAADFFFRPFGYVFHRPIPEPEPDVSPRHIGSILARHGFKLVGPLGYRGQQIVAAGVDAHGLRLRFLIDPYEEVILESWHIRPYPAPEAPYAGPWRDPYEQSAAPSEPTVIPGIDSETARRPASKKSSKPARAKTAARPAGETGKPAPVQKPTPKPVPAPGEPAPTAAAPPSAPAQGAAPQPAPPDASRQEAAPSASSAPAAPAPTAASAPESEQPQAPAEASAPAPSPSAEAPQRPAASDEGEPQPGVGG